MPLKKRKSFFLQVINSKLFIVTGIAVLVFLGVSLSKEVIRRHQISERVKSLYEEIDQLDKSNTELSDLIDYLKSESYREREARLKLGLQKEGESVVILPKNINENAIENSNQITIRDSSSPGTELNNIEKWWDYFFK